MKFTRAVLQLTTLFLALGASSFAADAYLYVVHSIPGRDIADNLNPGLPVDISISDECSVHGLVFGSTSGPFTLAPGTYNVQVSMANTLAPCTNAPMIQSQVTLTSGANVSAVAAISSGQPALLTFADNLTPITPAHARFVFVQAAEAPALQATFTQLYVSSPKTFTVTAAPDTEQAVIVPVGTYQVQVTASGSTTVLTSEQIGVGNQSAAFIYAAGEAANNSVGLVERTIRDVF
jgi:hypothetical protein